MKKIFLCLMSAVLISGCATFKNYYHNYQLYQQEQQTVTVRNYAVNYFDSLVVSGGMYVELKQGMTSLSSAAQKQYNDQITVQIKHRTLYVTLPASVVGKNVAVLINAPYLKSLSAKNHALVNADNLKAQGLSVSADSQASITLHGQMSVDQITQKSDGKIEIAWINSKKMNITDTGHGLVMLSGKAKELTVAARSSAQLDARYLRADRATVMTTDVATARIWAADSLNAYSDWQSNIYYYKIPQHLNVVTKDRGNILHIDWIQ